MKLLKMSKAGDQLVGDWTTTSSPDEILEVEKTFHVLRKEGFTAFGLDSGRRFDAFAPTIDEDVPFVAPMVGG